MRATWISLAIVLAAPPVLAQRGPDRAPAEGTKAPDFTLHRLQKDGTASEEVVKLGDAWKTKPVALVFGSYT